MSKVITDIDMFLIAATAIDDYVAKCRRYDSKLQALSDELKTVWKGQDSVKFSESFERIIVNGDSNNKQLTAYLEQFAYYLQECAKQYSTAKEDAQSRFARC